MKIPLPPKQKPPIPALTWTGVVYTCSCCPVVFETALAALQHASEGAEKRLRWEELQKRYRELQEHIAQYKALL